MGSSSKVCISVVVGIVAAVILIVALVASSLKKLATNEGMFETLTKEEQKEMF